jgi:hypothetical protein
MGFVFGEVDTELPAPLVPGDADANAAVPAVAGRGQLWNGTAWEREPANQEGTLLASAARIASTNSPVQVNRGHRGLFIGLDVTAASGTGGLRLHVVGIPLTGVVYLARAVAITAVGRWAYMVYPGISAPVSAVSQEIQQAWSLALPRAWYLLVVHNDASSYTYSLTYSLIR